MNETRQSILNRAKLAKAALTTTALAAPFAMSQAGAQGLDFDVAEVQTKGLGILGVGVAIAIGFAVFKVGKRAAGKM